MQAMPPEDLEPGGANAPLLELDGPPPALPAGATRLRWFPRPDAPLDALVVNRQSDLLVVSFHGALDRERTTLPRFERLRMLIGLPVTSVYFGDPTLHLADRLKLGWYTGWDGYDAQRDIAARVQQIAASTGAKHAILTGSSGGGFAALQVSALLPGSVALSFNAQTDIRNYRADGVHFFAQREYVEAVWPRVWSALEPPGIVETGTWDRTLDDRTSALRRYARPASNRVHIVQNADEFHYAEHFLPFVAVARAAGNDVTTTTNHQGTKHVVPTAAIFMNALRGMVSLEARRMALA